jgi:hypothetical protein
MVSSGGFSQHLGAGSPFKAFLACRIETCYLQRAARVQEWDCFLEHLTMEWIYVLYIYIIYDGDHGMDWALPLCNA